METEDAEEQDTPQAFEETLSVAESEHSLGSTSESEPVFESENEIGSEAEVEVEPEPTPVPGWCCRANVRGGRI